MTWPVTQSGLLRRQPRDQPRGVVGRAPAAPRHRGRRLLDDLLRRPAGVGRARVDGVDGDPARRQVVGQRARRGRSARPCSRRRAARAPSARGPGPRSAGSRGLPGRRRGPAAKAWTSSSVARTLTASVWSIASAVSCSRFWSAEAAWLATSTSSVADRRDAPPRRPVRARPARPGRSRGGRHGRRPRSPRPRPTAAPASCAVQPCVNTAAPSAASRRAIAKPIPSRRLTPVTSRRVLRARAPAAYSLAVVARGRRAPAARSARVSGNGMWRARGILAARGGPSTTTRRPCPRPRCRRRARAPRCRRSAAAGSAGTTSRRRC